MEGGLWSWAGTFPRPWEISPRAPEDPIILVLPIVSIVVPFLV